jgi:hypothetical protein
MSIDEKWCAEELFSLEIISLLVTPHLKKKVKHVSHKDVKEKCQNISLTTLNESTTKCFPQKISMKISNYGLSNTP